MASQSLYRKWRSQSFADLVGQEGVVHTLLNAVRDGRLAHAYLFCGPRGTGKTSVARLLAKAVNCQNPQNGEPCNECISCQEITSGRSPDVIEIDAASNNGVDHIRDLRESVNLLGSGGHHKVYIIDEAHMLSTAAFNALLKTLEEPPPHVIFVLATTEAHKVLATIVSRCQRFDFHRIRMREIVSHLAHVAEGEELTLEPAAAEMMARAAQGGMRDALSLLDQAIAFCGARIDAESVRKMLGLADPAALRALIEAVADQQTAEGLERIHLLVTSGADLRQLTAQYAEEWRALMLARAGADIATIMDRTAEEAQAAASLAGRFTLEELAACARVFARNEQPARGLPVPQLALELAFLECVSICSQDSSQGGSHDSAPPAQRSRPIAPASAGRPANPAPNPVERPTPPVAAHQPAPVRDTPTAEADELVAAPADMATYTPPEPPVSQPPQTQAASRAPATPAQQDGALLDVLRDIQRRWTMVKKVCKQKSSMVSGLLSDAQPVQIDAGDPPSLVIAVKWPFHLEKLREPSKRVAVEWALEQVLERPMRVRLVLASEGGSGQPATRPPDGPQRPPDPPTAPTRPDASVPDNIVPFPGTRSAGAPQAPQTAHAREVAAQPPAAAVSGAVPGGSQQEVRQPDVADVTALEREVRADPVIQELIRIGGTELVEVRPLGDDERS